MRKNKTRKNGLKTISMICAAALLSTLALNSGNPSSQRIYALDAEVTCENLVQTGVMQERNLSLPDSRLVINPFDFGQPVNTTQTAYSNRNTLPLNVGYCDPLRTTSHTRGLELKDSILIYQNGPEGTLVTASSFPSSWRPDRLVSQPVWADGMTATVTDVFKDTKTIVRSIATSGKIAIVGTLETNSGTAFSNNTISYYLDNGNVAISFSQNVASLIRFYSSKEDAAANINGTLQPSTSTVAYAIRLSSAPSNGLFILSFALNSSLFTPEETSALAASGAGTDMTSLLSSRESYWNNLLARVPQPVNFSLTGDNRTVTAAEVKKTYYSAWYLTITSLLPENPEGNYPYKSFATGKSSMWIGGETSAVYQSQWDSLYAMQLYALIDPMVAWNAFKGLISKVSDGMIAGENLPTNKAQTAWILYNTMPDKRSLQEVLPGIESHIEWGMTQPRWIYQQYTPDTSQKDMDFASSLLIDMIYLQKAFVELGNSDKAVYWQTQYQNFMTMFKTWFFQPDGSNPVQYYSAGGGRIAGNSSWITKSLHIPDLDSAYRTGLMNLYNSKYDVSKNFCGETMIKFEEYAYSYYGLMENGETSKAREMIYASIRDVVRSGWLSEGYNNPGEGSSNITTNPSGVRTSQFGASLLISGVLNMNGVRLDDGMPVFHNTFTANGGVRNITLDGVIYNITKTANQFAIAASNHFNTSIALGNNVISSLAADRQAFPFKNSVLPAYASIVNNTTQNHIISPMLPELWTNNAYEKEDTVNTLIGADFNMHFADFVTVGSEIWAYYIDSDLYGKMGIGLAKSTDGIHFTNYGVVLSSTPGAWDDNMSSFPGVYYYDGVFYLTYEGAGTNCNGDVGLATSTDGMNFTKKGKILTHLQTGWESFNIGTPDLYRAGNNWYLTYHGYEGTVCQVGVASGPDIFNLTRNVNNPVIVANPGGPDSGTIGRRDVTYYDGYYYMVYEISTAQPYDSARWSHSFARSTDMLNWTTLPQKNLIPQTNYQMANDGPSFLTINGQTWIYYRNEAHTKRAMLSSETNGGYDRVNEAEAMQHQLGREDTGGWSADITKDSAGFMAYGSYATDIPQGEVTGVFKAMIDNNTANSEAVLRLEAVDMTRNKVVASRVITRNMFTSVFRYEYFSLPFNNFYTGHIMEFRAYWYDQAYINMDKVLVNFGNSCRLPPANLLFEAESMSHLIGRPDGAGWSANVLMDQATYLVHGPYTKDVEAGVRKVIFKMKIDNNTADNGNVARIEVYDTTKNQILSQTIIARKDFLSSGEYQDFNLLFNHETEGDVLEFRVYWYGISYLNIDSIQVDENLPEAWIYEAESGYAQENTRTISTDGLSVICNPAVNVEGFFVFGSNYTILPGTYRITAVMRVASRSANPYDMVAGWDTYYKASGISEVSNNYEIRDARFTSLNTWTNIDMYFKTGMTLTDMQIRMKSYDRVGLEVDKFIIQKIADDQPSVVQAESITSSQTGTFTGEGILCTAGNPVGWATYGTRVVLDEGRYNIMVFVKQLQKSANLQAPVITFNLTYEKNGLTYNTGFSKSFDQSQFPYPAGNYTMLSIPVEVLPGERFTACQLMARFEGSTDILIDRFEIQQLLSFAPYLSSPGNIITCVSPGTMVKDFKASVRPSGALTLFSREDTGLVGTGTTMSVTFGGATTTYTILLYGDVDGNGGIDLGDMVTVKRHLLNLDSLTGTFRSAADIFRTGNITISSLIALKKQILGIQVIQQK